MSAFLASLRAAAVGAGWRSAHDLAAALDVPVGRVRNGLRLLATRRYGGHQLDARLAHNKAEYRLWPTNGESET